DHTVGSGRLGDHVDDDAGVVGIEMRGGFVEDERIGPIAEAVQHPHQRQTALLSGLNAAVAVSGSVGSPAASSARPASRPSSPKSSSSAPMVAANMRGVCGT